VSSAALAAVRSQLVAFDDRGLLHAPFSAWFSVIIQGHTQSEGASGCEPSAQLRGARTARWVEWGLQ
jgi:hypothetical protein